MQWSLQQLFSSQRCPGALDLGLPEDIGVFDTGKQSNRVQDHGVKEVMQVKAGQRAVGVLQHDSA